MPVIKNMQIAAAVSYDRTGRTYSYAYRIASSASNTGNVRQVQIDISTSLKEKFDIRSDVPQYKQIVLEKLEAQGVNILPVELTAPNGWDSVNLAVGGVADWGGTITPGESVDGLLLRSGFPPGIRALRIIPDISTWNLYPDADDPEAVIKEKEALIRSLDFTGYTLGPVGVTPGSFAHWNQVRADLNKAIELGWVPDATLASNLLSQLAAARKALNAGDGTAAKAKLHTLIETVMGASDAQRRPEVRDLLGLNARALIDHLTPQTNQARPG